MKIELQHLRERFKSLQDDIGFLEYLTVLYDEQKDDTKTTQQEVDKTARNILNSVYNAIMDAIQQDPETPYKHFIDEDGIQQILNCLDNIAIYYHLGQRFSDRGYD